MKIEFRDAKSIFTKSAIPRIDYVCNPYTGCEHGCKYCYASFMIRFTGHKGDTWGEFLDVKQFDFTKIKPQKYAGKSILISSVTDPYTPSEKKYKNTRKILDALKETTAQVSILTKSRLVTRDIDLFKQFAHISVGVSLNTLDEKFAREIEPLASTPQARLQALQEISDAGIPTYVFISPIFPGITDWKGILQAGSKFTHDFRFENLNFRPHNITPIFKSVERVFPEKLSLLKAFKQDSSRWLPIEEEIQDYCSAKNLTCKIEFHHGGFSARS